MYKPHSITKVISLLIFTLLMMVCEAKENNKLTHTDTKALVKSMLKEMVYVKGGSFLMGSPDEKEDIVTLLPKNVQAYMKSQRAMLYKLTETLWLSLEKGTWFDNEKDQELAVLVLLENIQTKKEFRKVIERITPDGQPGNFHSNLYRLRGILDGAEARKYYKFRSKLAYLLIEDNYPSTPNRMQPIRQRVSYV